MTLSKLKVIVIVLVCLLYSVLCYNLAKGEDIISLMIESQKYKDILIIEPFQNDYEKAEIGELTIENGYNNISIYGEVSITKDSIGLKNALRLQTTMNNIVAELKRYERKQNKQK